MTLKQLIHMAPAPMLRRAQIFIQQRRVNYWNMQRAFTVAAQEREAARLKKIDSILVEANNDLALLKLKK